MAEVSETTETTEVTGKGQWKRGLLPLHLLFLAMALLFVVVGSFLQHWNFNIGILATEFGMLVFPASLFMFFRKNNLVRQFRFNRPKASDLWKVTLAGLFFVPVVGLANGIVNIWLLYGLGIEAPQIPTESGLIGPVITFFIAAATPGFCEEFFFRGLLLTEYEKKMGYFKAALITALLFGLFHFNLMNFFGPFVLGLIFAWVMQVTNSIWTAMLGHMVNNSFAVVMLYLTAGVDQTENLKMMEQLGGLWPLMVVMTLLMLALIALPCGYVATLLLRSIRRQHLKPGDQLSISERRFEVLSAERTDLTLREQFADGAVSDPLPTTYARLYKNKNVRLLNRHWADKKPGFKLRLKEWWPVLICAIMYIGVNVLNVIALMADAVK